MSPSQPPKKSQKPSSDAKNRKPGARPPKQPLPVPEKLKRLFSSLSAQIEGGHFSNALRTCDKILRLDPHDSDAQKTKLFLLLQTEDYDGALTLIKLQTVSSGPQSEPQSQPSPNYAFEKAYSLYRLHHETEAKQILADVKAESGVDDRGVVHLEAQMCYRFGEFKEGLELYNDLLDTANPHTEEHSDILTNLEATQRYLDFIEHGFLASLNTLPQALTNSIESIPPPTTNIPSALTTAVSTAQPTPQSQTQTQTKKPRKSRIPPGIIPGVTPPPDPERWLKKSERTSYTAPHQGKRKKGHGGGGATQGSATGNTGVNVDVTSGTISSSGTAPAGGSKGGKKKKR